MLIVFGFCIGMAIGLFIDNGVSSVKEYKVDREVDRIKVNNVDAWKLAVE